MAENYHPPRAEMPFYQAERERERRRLYYAQNRRRINAKRRERYADDSEYRERQRSYRRKSYARTKRRYATDSDYAAYRRSETNAYYRANRERINRRRRERRANDSEYRERQLEYQRKHRSKDKAEPVQ